MALCTGIRQSRRVGSLANALKFNSSQSNQKTVASSIRFKHGQGNGNNDQGSGKEINWKLALKLGAAAGVTALALDHSVFRNYLLAEEKTEVDAGQEIIDKENR